MGLVGRPKMKEAKKRVPMSVSVAPKVIELAESTENKSKFIETSVLSMSAIAELMKKLRAKELSLESFMEEIEDLSDVWESSFDESEDFVFSSPGPASAT